MLSNVSNMNYFEHPHGSRGNFSSYGWLLSLNIIKWDDILLGPCTFIATIAHNPPIKLHQASLWRPSLRKCSHICPTKVSYYKIGGQWVILVTMEKQWCLIKPEMLKNLPAPEPRGLGSFIDACHWDWQKCWQVEWILCKQIWCRGCLHVSILQDF